VIAVVVAAASAHENAVGIALLDKVAADTDTVQKALVDQGFKNAVVAHGQKVGIAVEVVERKSSGSGICREKPPWSIAAANSELGLWSSPGPQAGAYSPSLRFCQTWTIQLAIRCSIRARVKTA